jgi:hypothetical protein
VVAGVFDAIWLARVAERQMISPSFVPPPAIRRLLDLTDICSMSGRDMAALVAGERNPRVLAQLARRSTRKKIPCWRRRSPGTSPAITLSC